MILSILDFFHLKFISGLRKISEFMLILCFPEMNELPQFFYGMVVIGSLSREGDGGGCGEGVGRALEGRWEGVGE